jgi:hypothetical protein
MFNVCGMVKRRFCQMFPQQGSLHASVDWSLKFWFCVYFLSVLVSKSLVTLLIHGYAAIEFSADEFTSLSVTRYIQSGFHKVTSLVLFEGLPQSSWLDMHL